MRCDSDVAMESSWRCKIVELLWVVVDGASLGVAEGSQGRPQGDPGASTGSLEVPGGFGDSLGIPGILS